jgi:hypothetical protein
MARSLSRIFAVLAFLFAGVAYSPAQNSIAQLRVTSSGQLCVPQGTNCVPLGSIAAGAFTLGAANIPTSLPSGLTAPTFTMTGLPLVTLTQDMASSRIEIDKDSAPLNFTGTRAGFVFQLTDTGSGTAQDLIPAVVFNMSSTGNGVVVPAPRLSKCLSGKMLNRMSRL